MLKDILNKVDSSDILSADELKFLLELSSKTEIESLFAKAYEVKLANVGSKAYFRGIVEFSNICDKDCYYCGIRKSNSNTKRFMMSEDEIVASAVWAYESNYGSIVLQAGERSDGEFASLIERVLSRIADASNGELGVTLSLGEQPLDVYRRWFEAGAHRYLLRVETSSAELYSKLHPADHSFEKRKECLTVLRSLGYQVGTGVMIGLPFQSVDDLVEDLLFFRREDIDMIGMGPYIVHEQTPLAKDVSGFDKDKQLEMGLKMVAVARVYLKDVNIAATTALQALNPTGREMGLKAGANIIMPNVTDTKYRAAYQLYSDKPCIDENSSMCRGCLQRRVESVGESIGFDEWGDSPHFFKRAEKSSTG